MSFLAVSELTDLRAEQTASLDKACVIRTPGAPVDDLAGGSTPGTPVDVITVCRVGVPSPSDQLIADRLGASISDYVTLPWDVPVALTAQIITGGRTYEVVDTTAEQSYQAATRCLCTEIK